MLPFPDKQYGLIYADPPWKFKVWDDETGLGKSAQAHYDCMDIEDIKTLPVQYITAPDCLLVMWTTWPFLDQALEVIDRWGFKYKSGGAWGKRSRGTKRPQHKLSKTQRGLKWAFGGGYIMRNACDPFLIASVGKPEISSHSIRNFVEARVREHSRKPDEFYPMLEALRPNAKKIELFARQRREGWDAWGNEVDKFESAA